MKQQSIFAICDESRCKAEKRRAMQQEKLEQEWKPQEGPPEPQPEPSICSLRQRYLESHSVHRARSPQAIWVRLQVALVKQTLSLAFFPQPSRRRTVPDLQPCLLLHMGWL